MSAGRGPRTGLPTLSEGPLPKVSLHVPAHAEPPEFVIATLDSLSRLHDANFEVLVIDNTSDPRLWRSLAPAEHGTTMQLIRALVVTFDKPRP